MRVGIFLGGIRDGSRWLRNENVTDRAEGPEDRKNDYVDIDDRTLLKVHLSPCFYGKEI